MSTRLLVVVHVVTCLMSSVGCKSNEPSHTAKVEPSQLQPGPIRHEELSPDLVARITKLHDTFQEVDPTPVSKWIDDFKRDQHPEREIEIYEGMARAYAAFCRGRALSVDAKREVYGVVIQRSAAQDDDVLNNIQLKVLTLDDVKAILKLYDVPPNPIRVTTTPQVP
jgi:hypothetical protein